MNTQTKITLVAVLAIFCCSTFAAGQLNCPPEGELSYPDEKDCDKYWLCTNGTLTYEECPNGLLYQGTHGAVYGHCAYQWNVKCEGFRPKPIPSPGCPWQFGFFHEDGAPDCVPFYSNCAWGIPERKSCHPVGLVYDERIKGCQWPDEKGCSGDAVVGVSCPKDDVHNRYYPYSRYYYDERAIVTCVNNSPRLIHCDEYSVADEHSLTCRQVKPRPKKVIGVAVRHH